MNPVHIASASLLSAVILSFLAAVSPTEEPESGSPRPALQAACMAPEAAADMVFYGGWTVSAASGLDHMIITRVVPVNQLFAYEQTTVLTREGDFWCPEGISA